MNVFISHSWAYSEHYEKLAEWIFRDEWYSNGVKVDFYNTSVPKDNPIHFASSDEQLRDAIYDRIKISNVVVIPTGMYAHHSKWIKKEIDGAELFAKPILAVDPWGQKKSSSVVLSASSDDVGWNKNSVVQGVWRLGRGGSNLSAKPSRSSTSEEQAEIYFLLVEMADRVSQRRQSANAFYLSVNTAVIGGASIGVVNGALWFSLAPVSVAGILICLLWIRSIRSYKNLNAAKFKIITELEKNLSVQPFKDEWDILDQDGDGVKHKPFHSTEIMVPFVFIFVHFSQFIALFQWSEGLNKLRDFLMC